MRRTLLEAAPGKNLAQNNALKEVCMLQKQWNTPNKTFSIILLVTPVISLLLTEK